MNERPKLNSLVFGILKSKSVPLTARQLYEEARQVNRSVIVCERATTFKSFVCIINSWNNIQKTSEHTGKYKILK